MVRVGGAYDHIGIQQAFDLGSDAILVRARALQMT